MATVTPRPDVPGPRRRLRVLYLTHHSPWPPTSGGRVRDSALVPRLASYADLEVWAVSRTADSDRAALPSSRAHVPVRVFDDESARRPYPTRDSADARALLRQRARRDRFDVVHVEGHYLHHLVPEALWPRVVVVEHNVESVLLRQRGGVAGCSRAAEVGAAVADERRAWANSRLVVTLSVEDRDRVLRRAPWTCVAVVGNGSDHIPLWTTSTVERRAGRPPRIGFLANYAYPPNRDALHWLLTEIMPAFRARLPDGELLLAGGNLPDVLDATRVPAGVVPVGWVDDLADFWQAIDVVVCPLRIGGGVKVKMLEAIRAGRAIVSTRLGVEGLPERARRAVDVVDETHGFAAAAARLCIDDDLRAARVRRIATARLDMPTWDHGAAQLHQLWRAVADT
jgi:glycosyltransferase involved in cell wall biosynthesis